MSEKRYVAVVTDAPADMVFEIERGIIEGAGGELRVCARPGSEEELIANVRDADALLVVGAHVTRRVVEAMPHCRHIVRYGVGLDTLDIPAATEHGIVVSHFPDFCQPEVANHAMLLLLACAKKLAKLDRWVREGKWRAGTLAPMGAITGETLGLVALGAIAREVVPRAQAFGMRVVAWDPYVADEVFATLGVERKASLLELLGESDYISVHAPLTPETRHLMSTAEFAAMKPSAYFINTARGPVVDEAALVAALQAGEIAGAGLDVFEVEPLPVTSPLIAMENVVLMPHSASFSDAAFDGMKRRAGLAVVEVMRGGWPEHVANPGVVRRG
ncbi:MAG: C-terminal binding protein [Tepidiformaceae bacterium]